MSSIERNQVVTKMRPAVDMECGQHESKRKQKTLFRTFLDDFERQQFDLSEKSKEELEEHKWTVATLFSIDMVFCYSIIGKSISAGSHQQKDKDKSNLKKKKTRH